MAKKSTTTKKGKSCEFEAKEARICRESNKSEKMTYFIQIRILFSTEVKFMCRQAFTVECESLVNSLLTKLSHSTSNVCLH